MIRRFCDHCGNEMVDSEAARLVRKLDRFTVEVMVATDDTWNKGELCHPCVVKVVTEGEPVGRLARGHRGAPS